MQTIFSSVDSYNRALSTLPNKAVPSNLYYNEVDSAYNGKDVFLTISDKEFHNESLGIANVQNVVNPPKLHLTVKNCRFDGGTSGYKQIYITNAQELNIDNCVFENNTVSDYGVDVNLCSIKGALINIKNSTFDNTGTKSAIKISARKGETDNPTDITVKTPATISKVTISNCAFANNVNDYTIGTTPKGNDTDANTTTGNYAVELNKNITDLQVKEPYLYDKDVTVNPVIVKEGRTLVKEPNQSLTEVNQVMLTDKQVHDLNNMNKAAQNAGLGTMLKDGVGGSGESYVLPAATTSTLGGVKQAATVSGAAGDNVTKAEFQALLDALKAAGIMA